MAVDWALAGTETVPLIITSERAKAESAAAKRLAYGVVVFIIIPLVELCRGGRPRMFPSLQEACQSWNLAEIRHFPISSGFFRQDECRMMVKFTTFERGKICVAYRPLGN